MRHCRRILIAVFVLLVAAMECACVHNSTRYRLIDLGSLNCPNGNCAVGTVNDVCEVAGFDEDPAQVDFAVVWQPTSSGVWTQIKLPAPTLQYGGSSGTWSPRSGGTATTFRAFGIDNLGYVIGYGKGPRNEAVLWRTRAAPDPLNMGASPVLVGAYLGGLSSNGGYVSEGSGINNALQTVGNSKDMQPTYAFQWSAAAGMTALSTVASGTTPTHAISIDDRGDIVGDVTVPLAAGVTTHAFFWDPNTKTMQDLGVLSGGQNISHAAAIISPGTFGPVAVGYSSVLGGQHAFVWRPSTGMLDIGNLSPSGNSGANAVGTSGVFGFGTTTSGMRAVGWPLIDLNNSPKNKPIDLNTLLSSNPTGAVLEEATGVNSIGIVAVKGSVAGSKHAFLLVPEIDDLPGFFGPSFFYGACGRPPTG
jgi:hypothetical protein